METERRCSFAHAWRKVADTLGRPWPRRSLPPCSPGVANRCTSRASGARKDDPYALPAPLLTVAAAEAVPIRVRDSVNRGASSTAPSNVVVYRGAVSARRLMPAACSLRACTTLGGMCASRGASWNAKRPQCVIPE